MKISLIGNCQIESIRSCLSVMLPSSEVSLHHSWNIVNDYQNINDLGALIDDSDLVLAHRFYNSTTLDFDDLTSKSNVVEFPALNFSSFHPDCIYLVDHDTKKIVRSSIGDYNSGLIAYSYSRGLTQEKCRASFREEVYNFLGYFSNWEASLAALNAEFDRCGFPGNQCVQKWLSRKPFVHSINHPRLFAIYDLVSLALSKAKVAHRQVEDIEEFVADPLLNYAGWPIYNEIAEYYGTRGSYVFKGNVTTDNSQYVFDLDEFINSSYELYANAGVRQFSSQIFETWDKIALNELIK
ncbi:WcbI family polysaccharide biosynthesis putative acetyltransferase [Agrobacterium sp. MCAB5]|uniref:WcbI family polysaccharide biosynthesis putative acetyltransferase n=1 Tax=Agrobacterium sp. MCAB5 TaxID=3233042 RepID=UPI003F9219F3